MPEIEGTPGALPVKLQLGFEAPDDRVVQAADQGVHLGR